MSRLARVTCPWCAGTIVTEDRCMSTYSDSLTQRNHGGLALLLAILGVPGTTLAWDLPAGGLWIGLPLAVAAIVLGRRAGGRTGIAAVVLGAVEILFMAAFAIAS